MTMLHEFFDGGDWFAPKRYGYGAGLPIAWQGWALLAAYMGAVFGLGVAAGADWPLSGILAFGAIFLLTIGFIVVVHRHTRGGWRWRWGTED